MANSFDFVPYIDCPEDAIYVPECVEVEPSSLTCEGRTCEMVVG